MAIRKLTIELSVNVDEESDWHEYRTDHPEPVCDELFFEDMFTEGLDSLTKGVNFEIINNATS